MSPFYLSPFYLPLCPLFTSLSPFSLPLYPVFPSLCPFSLAGDPAAIDEYGRLVSEIDLAYRRHREACYAAEGRWSDGPFWRRRLPLFRAACRHVLGTEATARG